MGLVTLYSILFGCLLLATALYFWRDRWLPYVQVPGFVYSKLPSSFMTDVEEGFTSSDFDLSQNLMGGDSRAGLDETVKKEIRKIMRKRKVDFDEARRIYMEQTFAKHGIGPDGRPLDPRFVSFS